MTNYETENRNVENKRLKNFTKKDGPVAKTKSNKNEPSDKAQLVKKVLVGVFFLTLLVVVFVGSAVGFEFWKCESGFRNVYGVSR